jgi:Ca2+-binding EF-hand superfamily protein
MPNKDAYVAYKVAVFYKKIFQFLDQDANDLLTEDDLVKAHIDYKWPSFGKEVDFVKSKFAVWDNSKDGKLDLVEFAHYMEDIWNVAAEAKKSKALEGLAKAKKVFEKLFEFLDDDKDESIDASNMKLGISYIMNKDIDNKDIEAVINKRGDKD